MTKRHWITSDCYRPTIIVDDEKLFVVHNPVQPWKRQIKSRLDVALPWEKVQGISAETVDGFYRTVFEIVLFDERDCTYTLDEHIPGFNTLLEKLPAVFPGFDQQACSAIRDELRPGFRSVCWEKTAGYFVHRDECADQ